MKSFKYLIVLSLFFTSLKADLKEEYSFAVTLYKMDKATQNRAKSVVLKTIKELSKILEEKVSVVFYEDEDDLLEEFNSFNKTNIMIIYSSFYLENKERLKELSKEPFLFYNKSNQKTQYYLIANKKSKNQNCKRFKK